MRSRILPVIVAVLAIFTASTIATAKPQDGQRHDSTPFTCDSKTLQSHIERGRAIIRHAYSTDRLTDPTPAKGSEKRAIRSHKFCVAKDQRSRISKYRDRQSNKYEKALAKATAPEWPTPESLGVSSSTLAAIRACESGGVYTTDTGNGFYGAYQFTLSTWASMGGSGNPAAASPAEQDYRAAKLYASAGLLALACLRSVSRSGRPGHIVAPVVHL